MLPTRQAPAGPTSASDRTAGRCRRRTRSGRPGGSGHRRSRSRRAAGTPGGSPAGAAARPSAPRRDPPRWSGADGRAIRGRRPAHCRAGPGTRRRPRPAPRCPRRSDRTRRAHRPAARAPAGARCRAGAVPGPTGRGRPRAHAGSPPWDHRPRCRPRAGPAVRRTSATRARRTPAPAAETPSPGARRKSGTGAPRCRDVVSTCSFGGMGRQTRESLMHRKLAALVLAATSIGVVATVSPASQAAKAATEPLRYVALGDSYSAASGVLPADPTSPVLPAFDAELPARHRAEGWRCPHGRVVRRGRDQGLLHRAAPGRRVRSSTP